MDFADPVDHSENKKAERNKFVDLVWELTKLSNMVMVISPIVGELRTVSKGLEKTQVELKN